MFKSCPQCQQPHFHSANGHQFTCQSCQFTYFHNTAAGVAGIIECQGKVLFTRRAKQPGLGLLDLPGGFVDHNESLEQALSREIQEELGISVQKWRYLCSQPNTYSYKDVTYKTCDCIFTSQIGAFPDMTLQSKEIESATWLSKDQLDPSQMAFESLKKAICQFWDIPL